MKYFDELCPQCGPPTVSAMKIIGLTGKAGSGKDSVGEVLEGLDYLRCSLAAELKQAVVDLDPYVKLDGTRMVRLSEIVGAYGMDDAKRRFPEVRRLLQVFGTEVIRSRNEDFWIDTLDSILDDAAPEKVVVTDVRFDNEAAWIHSLGGKVIEVIRPTHEDTGAANGHASESGVSANLVDDQILNDGTLDDLQLMVAGLVTSGTW